jgi:hypothetical protein
LKYTIIDSTMSTAMRYRQPASPLSRNRPETDSQHRDRKPASSTRQETDEDSQHRDRKPGLLLVLLLAAIFALASRQHQQSTRARAGQQPSEASQFVAAKMKARAAAKAGVVSPAARKLKVLVWTDVWLGNGRDLFDESHTSRCSTWCEFTHRKDVRAKASTEYDAVLISGPEWGVRNNGLQDYAVGTYPTEKPDGQQWVFLCIENPAEHKVCQAEYKDPNDGSWKPKFPGKFELRVTGDFYAELPALYTVASPADMTRRVDPAEGAAQRALGGGEMASFVYSKCRPERDAFARALMEHGVTIAAYGSCLGNKPAEASHWKDRGAKLRLMRRHLFNIAYEGTTAPYYITEKFWDGFRAGIVTVYWGDGTNAITRAGIVPEGSFIDARNFSSTAELAARLVFLAGHPAEYQKLLAWRERGAAALGAGYHWARAHDFENLGCNMCDELAKTWSGADKSNGNGEAPSPPGP